MSDRPDLWSFNHPYYCEVGNFYAPIHNAHAEYDSWRDFCNSVAARTDPDRELLFRWDLHRAIDVEDRETGELVLKLYWMTQSVAACHSTWVTVTESDQPQIREWLAQRARIVAALWAPFLTLLETAEATP